MVGVIALNYHAMLNEQDAFMPLGNGVLGRLFNPVSGVLTTRFAATFVFVAGIGVTLLATRHRSTGYRDLGRVHATLVRRGAFLLLVGTLLEWIWPGTILFYYGAYFMIAGVIVHRSTRTLVVLAGSSVAIAAVLNAWRVSERFVDNYTPWLDPVSIATPRAFVIRLFVGYTHPVLPWISFFIAGMVVGRMKSTRSIIGSRLAMVAGLVVVLCYVLRDFVRPALVVDRSDAIRAAAVSLQPFDRGILYVVSTLGIAIVATWAIERLVGRFPRSAITAALAQAGRMSLTIYVAHIVVYKLIVDVFDLIRSTGLGTALAFSAVVYLLGIGSAWMILARYEHGPVEWLYRKIDRR
jgi:uncharacterized protein